MLAYPKDEFPETIARARAATLRQKLQIKLAASPSHNVEQCPDVGWGLFTRPGRWLRCLGQVDPYGYLKGGLKINKVVF